jgi:hypothetical protein
MRPVTVHRTGESAEDAGKNGLDSGLGCMMTSIALIQSRSSIATLYTADKRQAVIAG